MSHRGMGDSWAYGRSDRPFKTHRRGRWPALAGITALFVVSSAAIALADVPSGQSISINGGAASTNSLAVTVTVAVDHCPPGGDLAALELAFSNVSSAGPWTVVHAAGTNWPGSDPDGCTSGVPSSPTTDFSWTLASGGDGARTVFARFKHGPDEVLAQDSITFEAPPSDTAPPVVTISIDAADTVASSGWYNIASSGADGALVHVSASDPSDVTNITCTDYSTEVANTSSNPTSFTLGDLTHSISCQATDGASPANTGAGSGSTPMPVSLLIDQTAPSGVVANPSRGADKNGWYNAPFDVTWSGSDATSGISSCTQTSYSGPDVDSGSLSGSCTDVAGNTSSSVPFPFKFDNTDPTVSLSVPANGADYLKDQVVNASYSCNDATSPGSGLDTCVGTVASGSAIDTGSFGSHGFTVTAEDQAGNTTSITHTYSVTYRFDGFYQPVDNLPTPNKAKAGQTIPFKWNLLDSSGNKIENDLGLFTVGWGTKFSCDSSSGDVIESYDTSGQSGLRWDDIAKQYVFTGQSVKSDANYCRYLIVQVGSSGLKKALVSFTR